MSTAIVKQARKGIVRDNYLDEAIRLYNNLASVKYKAGRDAKAKRESETYHEALFGNIPADKRPDENGIRPIDRRRYAGCFKSYYVGFPIDREYIMRMTGLSLAQLYILQGETFKRCVAYGKYEDVHFVPYPAITKTEVKHEQDDIERYGVAY